jgi:protein-L-isoaspartate(D-aspartate) O-methyltransferase
VPETLKEQLSIGGCLVIPVGPERRAQRLLLVTRQSEHDFDQKRLSHVRFVPLIGEEGWDKNQDRWLGIF